MPDRFLQNPILVTCLAGNRKRITKMLRFLLLLVIVSSNANLGANGQDAEEMLSNYLLKYENFYSEFSLRYRGERFSRRPNAANESVRERLLLVEGLVADSLKNKFSYGGEKQFSPDGGDVPFRNEEFFVKGKQWNKGYSISIEKGGTFNATTIDDPAVEMLKIVPRFHPHALALLRYNEVAGSRANMNRTVDLFLKHKRFRSSRDEGDICRGIWEIPGADYATVIDFSRKLEVPTKVKWSSEKVPAGTPKGLHETTTTWSELPNGILVPKVMTLYGVEGENVTEFRYEFEFLAKDVAQTRIAALDPQSLVKMPGTAWWDEFSSWYEKSQDRPKSKKSSN
jgi:hypothetical protein